MKLNWFRALNIAMANGGPGRPGKGALSPMGRLFVEALERLNEEWVQDGRAHAPFLHRPWSEAELVEEMAQLAEARGKTSQQRLSWARRGFKRGLTNAENHYLAQERDEAEERLRHLRSTQQIDQHTRRAFTKSLTARYQDLLTHLPELPESGVSHQQVEEIERAMKRRPGKPFPENLNKVLLGLMNREVVPSQFYDWVTAPTRKAEPVGVFQRDAIVGSTLMGVDVGPGRYILPPPVTAEEASKSRRLSEVYALEVTVHNLRVQLENLPPASLSDCRLTVARSVEGMLHEVRYRLALLRKELGETLFKEAGVASNPRSFEDWKKQRFLMPPGSMALGVSLKRTPDDNVYAAPTSLVGFPPARRKRRKQLSARGRAPRAYKRRIRRARS